MKNKIVPLTITDIGAKGDGIAAHNGAPVFVPKTAPGDVIEASVKSERGILQKIIAPSPQRVEAPCPYFQKCGGCSLQHVSGEFYRNWKIAKVQNALARANVTYETWNEPVFLQAATRRRTSVTALKTASSVILGYNEGRSHNILNIQRCLILNPVLDAKVQAFRAYLPRILPDKKPCDVTLQLTDGALDVVLTGPLQTRGKFSLEQDEAFGEMMEALDIARLSWRKKDFVTPEIILSRRPVTKKFGAVNVALPPAAFLQASDEGEDALATIVLHHAKGASKILDLFSGCGTFTGHLLQNGASITAIDGDPAAINALAATKHPNLTARQRDLFKNPLSETELEQFDTVIFDPPRAGAKEQAGKMAFSNTRKIIGVSCNPASFARDAVLLQEGGYKLKSLTLVDQFVWSAHVELVSLFSKS